MSPFAWLAAVLALLVASFVIGVIIAALVLVTVESIAQAVGRRRERRLAVEREQQRIAEQVNASVTRLQAAYWHTQQRLRDEVEKR